MDVGRNMFNFFLIGPKQFRIPIYQRNYSWGKKQWEQLFKDVNKVGSSDKKNHFIGSVVYTSHVLDIPTIIVIDGQQRITTLSLLIAALANCLIETNKYEKLIGYSPNDIVDEFLLNNNRKGDLKYKLLLTKDDDAIYKKIIDSIIPNEKNFTDDEKNHQIYKAYEYFNNQIKENNIVSIWDGIKKLQIVYLNLEEGQDDSPQEIFESLNSTGKRLNDTDLIRNFILMDLKPDEQQEIYEKWHPIENTFKKSSEFEDFIKYYLTVKRDNWVPNEVYEEFKKFKGEKTIPEIVEDISKYLEIYKKIVFYEEKNSKLKKAFKSIDQLPYNIIRPFLMKLYEDYEKGELSLQDYIGIIKYSESYLLRRNICDRDSQSIKGFFDRMHQILIEETSGPKEYLNHFKYILSTRTGKTSMPDDEEFEKSLTTTDLYSKKNIAKYVLIKFNNYNSDGGIDFNSKPTIEHIMPQNPKLSQEWQKELESDGSDWEETHTNYLHILGNLTITSSNSELGDKPFIEKRKMDKGYDKSAYIINHYFEDNDIKHWNKTEINKRSKYLFEKAKEIWELPKTTETRKDDTKEVQSTLDIPEKMNIRYWTMCKKQIAESPLLETNQTPKDLNHLGLPINSKSANIELRINSISKEVKTRLIIEDKKLYEYLEKQKPDIKSESKFDLEWESLETRKSSTITVTTFKFDLDDDLQWKKSIKWQIEVAEEFYKVFYNRIQEFKKIEESEK